MARATSGRPAARAAARRRISLLLASALALTGFVDVCGAPPEPGAIPLQGGSDPDVVDGYRSFARGDCAGVGSRARSLDIARSDGPRARYLRLLAAYCTELGGDLEAARTLYSALVDGSAIGSPGFEAALRLHDLARRVQRGSARAAQPNRRFEGQQKEPPAGPRPIRRADPTYPVLVRDAGVEGSIIVDFEIEGDGSVADPIVLESHPPFVFDSAVLDAIRSWTYEPSASPMRKRVKLKFEIAPPGA